jgi:hypothetical protein
MAEVSTMRGYTRLGTSPRLIFALICVAALVAGCSKSETDSALVDTSHLPRVAGAKETFASAATTIFIAPDSVAQTADATAKVLAAAGWQPYSAPATAQAKDQNIQVMSLKKGPQAVNVSVALAPAQGNATSVNYTALSIAHDLPFTKDASNAEYDPNSPLLTLVTAESVDNTLDFYRKELGTLGWSPLYPWPKPVGQSAPVNASVKTANGAYAYFARENQTPLLLVLQRADGGRTKVELKPESAEHLASEGKHGKPADALEMSRLPRLEGAKDEPAPASSDRLVYTVPGSVVNTIAATKILFAANGWKQYVPPLDDPDSTTIWFKKGPQGLLVFFTMAGGQATESSVNYVANRIIEDLPFPDAATDFVFDDRRPYLNCIATGTLDANLDFFRRELGASGWSRLSAADAAARWPKANIDEKRENGALAYYIRENQLPVLLSLQRRDDDKIKVEIKVASFAEPQDLEAGQEVAGLPTPKGTISSSGYGNSDSNQRKVNAAVPAEVGAVLAFYRRELAKHNWKEETHGAVLNPDEVTLAFSSADETAVLKLGRRYDLTIINLAAQVRESVLADRAKAQKEATDKFQKEADEIARAAIAASDAKRVAIEQSSKGPVESLRPRAEKIAPVLLPETAENIDFNAADGKLEFDSSSSVKALAAFYRTAMKQEGWAEESSVINSATMVELNFSKGGKAISFTIMQLGSKANVTADGSALVTTATKPAAPEPAQSGKTEPANPPAQAAADLEAEEISGLPVPKNHTMSAGAQSPFRREVTASVPADLAAVLAFYRRELGKLDWKEEAKGAVITMDRAVIAFSSLDGPAALKLGRQNGETSVNLAVKNPGAATKAGIISKPGQAKLLFGNSLGAEAVITINKQTVKIAAGAGTKGPDGPTLDLAPGQYKFSIQMPGGPAQNDEVVVSADETWGLLVGPGGALPLQMY